MIQGKGFSGIILVEHSVVSAGNRAGTGARRMSCERGLSAVLLVFLVSSLAVAGGDAGPPAPMPLSLDDSDDDQTDTAELTRK